MSKEKREAASKENLRIKLFQLKNCKGCFFADFEKVGTGEPCCTKPTPAKMRDAETCIDRRIA